MSGNRLTGLDGLRGIAAVSVLGFHVLQRDGLNGFLAVDFFFMLSGYVMARTYESGLSVDGAAGRFLTARVLRLWPVMAFASLFGMPWLWVNASDHGFKIALANLFLIPTPNHGELFPINPPSWSILFELLANVVHALVLYRLSNRQLWLLLAALVPTLALLASQFSMNMIHEGHVMFNGMVRVLCPYVIGILLYRTWRDKPPVRVPAYVTWLAMPAFFIGGSLAWGTHWIPDVLFVVVLCPLLIAGGLQHGAGSRIASFAGALSFPLYAIHGPVLMNLREWGVSKPVQLVACLVAGWMLMQGQRLFLERRRARRATASQPAAA